MAHRERANSAVRFLLPGPGDGLERRQSARGTARGEPSRARLVVMIEGTYREMPGLSLFLSEAARLFGLREKTCEVILDDLVRKGRLRRSADGRYRA
jgi:hypothetical protein